MSDTRTEPAETNRSPRLRFVLAIICIAGILTVLAIARNKAPRLRPGQVVDKLGTYRFPTGNRELAIDLDDSSTVHITTRQFSTEYYIIPKVRHENIYSFKPECDWFVSVDDYERLWIFRDRRDKAPDTKPQFPSNGTVPFAPVVIMTASIVSTLRPTIWTMGRRPVNTTPVIR